MEITEVRIKLMNDPHERLLAFCSVTLDGCFVVRDLKIIQGGKGAFVAMPSRKLTDHCPKCHGKNHLRSRFCSECGCRLDESRADLGGESRTKLYADIAHPINSECRERFQASIIAGYEEEIVRARQPNYVCSYEDYGEDRVATAVEETPIAEENAPEATTPVPDAPRRFATSDDRTHRIDPAENPRRPARHEPSQPQRAVSRVGEDGFEDGLV